MLEVEDGLPPDLTNFAVRMANEGIPVTAIGRCLAFPAATVRVTLEAAKGFGMITEMPAPDWPPTARRSDHLPVFSHKLTPEEIVATARRMYGLSNLKAAFLSVLLTAPTTVDKDKLHHVVEQERATRKNRPNDQAETDPKMVDVIICNMRKELRGKVTIKTVWGNGYFIETAERRKILADLAGASAANDNEAPSPAA